MQKGELWPDDFYHDITRPFVAARYTGRDRACGAALFNAKKTLELSLSESTT
jgi:hypothetical protein